MTTAEMAEVLRQYYIDDTARLRPEAVSRLNEAAADRCSVKTHIFRLALVLMTLRRKEENDARLGEVLLCLEKLTYPEAPSQSVPFAMSLGAATQDISRLISIAYDGQHGTDKTPSWARDWLAEIGVDENNVIRAATFALSWLHEVSLVSDIIDECRRKLVV
jgi:hypothetical protein